MINYVNLNKTYDNNYGNFQQIKMTASDNYEDDFNENLENDSFALPDNSDVRISFDRGHRPPIQRDEVDEKTERVRIDENKKINNNEEDANNDINDNVDSTGKDIDKKNVERPKFDEHKTPNKPHFPKRPPKNKLPNEQTINDVNNIE